MHLYYQMMNILAQQVKYRIIPHLRRSVPLCEYAHLVTRKGMLMTGTRGCHPIRPAAHRDQDIIRVDTWCSIDGYGVQTNSLG
jgi:hypothetical protein